VSEWFTGFFDALANDVWEAAMSPEATQSEVAWLQETLALQPGSTVLDVPCGRGRLALGLAGRGLHVVGVDLSPDALDRLRRRARDAGLDVDVRQGDMRDLVVPPVDGAFCMGNSVGYFGPEGLVRFLAGVARAVRSGGRFVIDTSMAAESVLAHFEPESTFEAGGISMSDRNHYEPRSSRLDTAVTFERLGVGGSLGEGTPVTRHMSVWVITSGELVRLVSAAGFDVEGLLAGTDGTPFELGSPRLLLVARRH
jgi:SAM-dependent methyltransferase